MAAFATVADFATFLGRDLTAQDTATASQALDLATGSIRAFTRQTLSAVDGGSVTFYPDVVEPLWLPERPVRAVDSVNVDGVVQGSTLYRVKTSVWLEFLAGADWGDVITVTYDHGYEVIPDDIRAVCLQMTARVFSNPTGTESESVGPLTEGHGAVRIAPTSDEQIVLGQYRLDPLSVRVG